MYQKEYDKFMQFSRQNESSITSMDEKLLFDVDSLTKDTEKASTICTVVSVIKTSLFNENTTITASTYYKITRFLSQKGKRDTTKQSKVLSQQNITDFLKSNQWNLEDYQNKSVLIVGFFCAMRMHRFHEFSLHKGIPQLELTYSDSLLSSID